MAGFKQFSQNLKKRAEFVSKNVPKAVRATALAVDQQVVQSTPVDTGRARSNWIASLNQPVTVNREPYSAGENGSTGAANVAAAIQQAASVISTAKSGNSIWISNSVPYIGRLNEGSSAQAPANFVETSLMRGVEVVRRAKLLE